MFHVQPKPDFDAIQHTWVAAWQPALDIWSRFVKLREPAWCRTAEEERAEALTGSFAMIRLNDHTVVISLRQIAELGLQDFAVEVLAHEIGHHVYCPADLTDNARLAARIRAGLPTKEHLTSFVSNLYSDLLINDRLQRGAALNIAGVYEKLGGGVQDRMWTLYMRIYEILWRLPQGQHARGEIDGRLNQDAQLAARLIRSYAKEWLDGAGRFAALCLPYLIEDEAQKMQKCLAPWLDTACAGSGEVPDGLAEIDPFEIEGAIHPSEDPELSGVDPTRQVQDRVAANLPDETTTGGHKSAKSYRDPIQYLDVLRAAG
ncbi:MAG: VWA domain-containing protein, partial [Betaproteobacteria bacterium]